MLVLIYALGSGREAGVACSRSMTRESRGNCPEISASQLFEGVWQGEKTCACESAEGVVSWGGAGGRKVLRGMVGCAMVAAGVIAAAGPCIQRSNVSGSRRNTSPVNVPMSVIDERRWPQSHGRIGEDGGVVGRRQSWVDPKPISPTAGHNIVQYICNSL